MNAEYEHSIPAPLTISLVTVIVFNTWVKNNHKHRCTSLQSGSHKLLERLIILVSLRDPISNNNSRVAEFKCLSGSSHDSHPSQTTSGYSSITIIPEQLPS